MKTQRNMTSNKTEKRIQTEMEIWDFFCEGSKDRTSEVTEW